MTDEIDGFAKDTDRLLRSMEPDGIFGFDKIEIELGFALKLLRGLDFCGIGFRFARVFDFRYKLDERVHGLIAHLKSAGLNYFGAIFKFLFGNFVTGLAGAVDIEQGAADMVV